MLNRLVCPKCNQLILRLAELDGVSVKTVDVIWPKGSGRAPCPPEAKDVADDYDEACLILRDSPQAAAALGRRILQRILREKAQVTAPNLAQEIDQVLNGGSLPSQISEAIDAIRNVGNFAAHPMKSKQTDTILPVEPGEAEWTLDTVEALIDFYYVQPARLEAKRAALNKKLNEAGKPPLK